MLTRMTSLTSPSAADRHRPPGERPWWRDAVVYQVYLRSFADSDGDGIGDLEGLRRRLDHIAGLGATGIWINPCYPSPQADHGYDVADYFDIEPAYGDLATFDRLLADAHARGLHVLMDVVPNHCSSRHAWFQAALAAAPGSPERARFIFRDGQGPGRLAAAEPLALGLRRPRLDPRHGGGRQPRPVVPAPVRPRPAGLRLAQPRGRRHVRAGAAVLVRPRRRRFPDRRGARSGEGRRPAGVGPASARGRRARPPVPDVGPARGARRLPALAADRASRTQAATSRSSARSGCTTRRRWRCTCAPTSCRRRSTSTC